MIRFLFRVLGLVSLSVAVILAVLDGARSVAASRLILTPLGTSWYSISPDTLNGAQAGIQRYLHPSIWDPVMIWVLNQPGAIVLAILSAIFYMLGRQRLT
jgi:hypothetical protein